MAEDLRTLIRLRGRLKGSITRLLAFAENPPENVSIMEVAARIQRLRELWEEFEATTKAIYTFSDQQDCPDVDEDYADYEDKVIAARGLFDGLQSSLTPTPQNSGIDDSASRLADQQAILIQQLSSNSARHSADEIQQHALIEGLQNLVQPHNDVVLPKIIIPTFSGEYSAWKTFSDIFKGAVDSKSNLSNTQKFYYLASFLSGEAADLIKNIPITNTTYVQAWDKLEQRYNRPHLVARSFIKTFMKLPSTTSSNPKMLRKVIDGADECLRGLSAIDMQGRDPWLIFILLNKLDAETRHVWFEHVGAQTNVIIDEFLKFLDTRFIHLESNELHTASGAVRNTSVRAHVTATVTNTSCAFCNGQHHITKCPEFITASITDRRKQIKSKSICFNCLRLGHRVKQCKSNYSCRVCNARHHTLIHVSNECHQSNSNLVTNQNQTNTNNVSLQNTNEELASHHVLQRSSNNQIVMPTAMVVVKDEAGRRHQVRALVDTGSQVSFISETCVQRIGVSRLNARLHIKGISSAEAGMTKGCVDLVLSSQQDNSNVSVRAYILHRITADIPKHTIDNIPWQKISSLRLADPHFSKSAPIDMLLGADIAWNILIDGKLQIEKPNLFAINSIFGWILSGQLNTSAKEDAISSYAVTINVDKLLTKFWELDECSSVKEQSNHDDPAELHFRKTHTRSMDGRYIVQLPFKEETPTFTNTVQGAIVRMNSMERRFLHNSQLQQQYSKFMNEYVSLGHMQQIPVEEIDKTPNYYLPHHAVFKPSSTTTKLRVVFDGSHTDAKGRSLNDQLLIGPPIQRDLFGVSLRFRKYKYVFVADITKMFRQIWVSPIHQDYQRIVWRESRDDPLKHYRLCTVTYGTASAPFLSVRVLQQLALDNVDKFPGAANIIFHHIYVDDVMAGGDSVHEVIQLKTELLQLLQCGGFNLRKWSSNSSLFLQAVPAEDCETVLQNADGTEEDCIKILGLYWSPKSDKYSFHVKESNVIATTKRHILSEIARIFDVFGFLAPVVVKMKILFQELWLIKADWDDELPDNITSVWHQIRDTLHYLEAVSVPRHIFQREKQYELHGFCDASISAYAAVIYSVCTENNVRSVSLVAAKTRVAPLKAMSIPRLELCSALLLARLYSVVKGALNITADDVYAWTDSQVVLHWLSSPPRNWKMFVGNRTEEILDCLPRRKWNYIYTGENPADSASRGLNPEQLLHYDLWWTGPQWLSQPKSSWPNISVGRYQLANEVLEQRVTALHVDVNEGKTGVLIDVALKGSSFQRIVNVIAYIFRFTTKLQKKHNTYKAHLEHAELQQARGALFIAIQQESFESTFRRLKSNGNSRGDKLISLSPFIDPNGILRVGGRIQQASISYNIKHPIILPRHHLSKLIIAELHTRYLHVGVNELFVIVRQRYWVLGARNLIRSVVHHCKRCFMLRKQTSSQRMADLPDVRLKSARPFLNSGCDFAGPINIKMTNCKRPRTCKSYICLFVCLSTKAIHLELAADLSSEAFIAAFKRFTSRRGKCSNLYSDNGTNFHGAHRFLTDMHRGLLNESFNRDIYVHLAGDGTAWHFIPPSSPHFGGIWQSNIKSVKLHLRRVIGESLLSFEELYTVLTQIESILNSRPLCGISDTDLNPLTPAHFLIGEPMTAVPEPINPIGISLSRSYNNLRSMVQGFWKRWSMEYLTSLQHRTKWTDGQPNFTTGDLVVIKDPNLPPTKWILGRIDEVHPGPDGRVRVVTLRTEKGIYKRPITKIALLPIRDLR